MCAARRAPRGTTNRAGGVVMRRTTLKETRHVPRVRRPLSRIECFGTETLRNRYGAPDALPSLHETLRSFIAFPSRLSPCVRLDGSTAES